jgi:hypothetical protein
MGGCAAPAGPAEESAIQRRTPRPVGHLPAGLAGLDGEMRGALQLWAPQLLHQRDDDALLHEFVL